MKDKIIHLNIANFNIQLRFVHDQEATQYHQLNQLFTRSQPVLKPFIISKPLAIDLEFKLYPAAIAINKQQNKHLEQYQLHYFNLYPQKNLIESAQHISINQLLMMLMVGVEYLLLKTNSGIFLHGSSIIVKHQGYVFTGPSGIGKSTLIQLLKNTFTIFSDDLFILKKELGKWQIYQTPLLEKRNANIKRINQGFKLKNIFWLQKNKNLKVTTINNSQTIFHQLMNQIWTNNKIQSKQIKLVKSIDSKSINFFRFDNNLDKKKIIRILKQS